MGTPILSQWVFSVVSTLPYAKYVSRRSLGMGIDEAGLPAAFRLNSSDELTVSVRQLRVPYSIGHHAPIGKFAMVLNDENMPVILRVA
jgi:hypothetical protein